MVRFYYLPVLFLIFLTFCGKRPINNKPETPDNPPAENSGHPRILLLKGEEGQIRQSISADPSLKKVHDAIISESNKMLNLVPLERVVTGRRLLSVSREAIRRIFFLSYSWRMTNDDRYYRRAEQEMVKVASFSDWNPSHFLDVAEMTLGMAIGYDWLYSKLPTESRAVIKQAIVKKGIEPSFNSSYNSWLRSTNNWNQVCNTGISYGAMAIYEDYKDSADLVISRAISSLPVSMNMYNPDGAYPEGYGYWGYGTAFNVLFIDAYEKFKNVVFDLSSVPGFLKTAEYMLHMTGPSGDCFNYSDSGLRGYIQPAMYWFAAKKNDWSLLSSEKSYLAKNGASAFTGERILPALLVWSKGKTMNDVTSPNKNMWVGKGINPVAMMRSSWQDPNAIYATLKCGTPSASHAHMDAGSFVMDADGERWASDFGMQDYNSLETQGVDLWNMNQNSQRWTIFRYNNLAHNTLSVNNQYQVVKGSAPLVSYSSDLRFMNAVTDLTAVYAGQLTKANRGVAIVDGKYVVVRDELTALPAGGTLRWSMLTTASAQIIDNTTIALTKGQKKILLKVRSASPVTIKTWPTVGTNSYDAPNPGTVLVGFEAILPPGDNAAFNVFLTPERNAADLNFDVTDLAGWPRS